MHSWFTIVSEIGLTATDGRAALAMLKLRFDH